MESGFAGCPCPLSERDRVGKPQIRVQSGSNNSSQVLLTALNRVVGAVCLQSVTIGCVSFTAVTRVQIPSGTPNLSSHQFVWAPSATLGISPAGSDARKPAQLSRR